MKATIKQRITEQYQVTLSRQYGMTASDFLEMEKSQNNCCAICSKPPEFKRRRGKDGRLLKYAMPIWNVDHDHETGAVRSLLCTKCNTGLGKFDDDPVLVLRAARYLFKHRERQVS